MLNGAAIRFVPNTAQEASAITNVINMSYGRDEELESDELSINL